MFVGTMGLGFFLHSVVAIPAPYNFMAGGASMYVIQKAVFLPGATNIWRD